MNNEHTSHNGHIKSIPEVIADLKTELQEFVSTRVAMLRSELQDNLRSLKMAAPVLIIGLVLLWTAWLLFTGFLVAIIGVAFGSSTWGYVISLLIVAAGYLIVGGLAAMTGWKKITQRGIKPERTIRVLQQDKIWIQAESKAQL
jgi:hypothetical protein